MSSRDLGVQEIRSPYGGTIYTNSWAIVAGINQYADPRVPRLRFAEADAIAVAGLLPKLGFPESNVHLLLGSRDKLAPLTLWELLDDLDLKMSVNDRFLFFLAGHGVTVKMHGKRSGHLLTPESDLQGPWAQGASELELKPARSVEMTSLLHKIDLLTPKHKLLVVDACFSGFVSVHRDVRAPERATPVLLDRWTSQPATEYLVAGSAEHKSTESDRLEHGVFTYHLLEGLRGAADVHGEGLVSSFDLAAFLKRRVPESGVNQDPQYGTYREGEGHFCFVLESPATVEAITPAHEPEPKEQPPEAAPQPVMAAPTAPLVAPILPVIRTHETVVTPIQTPKQKASTGASKIRQQGWSTFAKCLLVFVIAVNVLAKAGVRSFDDIGHYGWVGIAIKVFLGGLGLVALHGLYRGIFGRE